MDIGALTALVTGAAGFVGANLVRALLARGARVHAVLRSTTDVWRLEDVWPRLQVHRVDLCDRSAVAAAVTAVAPDVVFHFAKHRGDPAGADYRSAYQVNLDGTLNLLEAVKSRRLISFVHAGSSLEYDLAHSPLREEDAPAPMTTHGVTKAAATLLCQHFARVHRLPAVTLRLFTVYGPWEGPARFVPSAIVAALEGGTLRVTRPDLRHDWVFVGDVVEACLQTVSTRGIEGEVINIGTGRETTNQEIVRHVEELCAQPVRCAPEAFPDRPWDSVHWVADTTKAQRLLGWRASHGVRAGLASTVAWLRQHRDAYRLAREA